MPGKTTILAGKHLVKTSLSVEEPLATVNIDLGTPAASVHNRRKVIFRFVQEERLVTFEGRVNLSGWATEEPRSPIQKRCSPINGTISIEVPVPGSVRCDPDNVVGWHFRSVLEKVEPGKEPLTIDVPVVRAGAVQGCITLPPGYSTDEVPHLSVRTKRHEKGTLHRDTILVEVGDDGRFFATPVPLEAECQVKVWVGHNVQVSELFTLEAEEPLREVDLQLPRPIDAVAEFVDPNGHPVPDLPVELHWEQPGTDGHSWNENRVTDQDGRIEFREVNAVVPQYFVRVDSRQQWQPALVPVRVDRRITRIRLQRGKQLVVTAIDSVSGNPVPGVEVYAYRPSVPGSPDGNAPRLFEAETPTDEFGRARFSNLPDAVVKVGLRGMSGSSVKVDPGRVEQLEVRGKIPEGSDLRPRDLRQEVP